MARSVRSSFMDTDYHSNETLSVLAFKKGGAKVERRGVEGRGLRKTEGY